MTRPPAEDSSSDAAEGERPVVVELLRPAPYALVTAALIFAGGMFLLGLHGAPYPHLIAPIATALVVWMLGSLMQPRRLRLEGRVEADETGLFLDGISVARRRELGWQVRDGDTMTIVDRFGSPLLQLSGKTASVDQIESALGISPGGSRSLIEAELPQRGRWDGKRVIAMSLLAAAAVATVAFAFPGIGLAAIAAATAVVLLMSAPFIPRRPRTLRIGADGLAYATPGKAGFLRFRPGQQARASGSDVVVEDADGRALLRLGTRSWLNWPSRADVPALAHAIQAAIDAPASSEETAAEELVPSAEGSAEDWLEVLSNLARGALSTHRTAAPSADRLFAAASASHASPLVRVGAAHMLVEQNADVARSKVRRIAANTADGALRDTLELLASDAGAAARQRELEVAVEQLREREAEMEASSSPSTERSRSHID